MSRVRSGFFALPSLFRGLKSLGMGNEPPASHLIFLRQRGHPTWEKESRKAELVRDRLRAGAFTAEKVLLCTPEVAANTLLCLVNQASYLLGRQIVRLETDFLSEGGFTEKLHAARTKARDARAPSCPVCGLPMRERTANS